MSEEKQCSYCWIFKSIDNFNIKQKNSDWLSKKCKSCTKEYDKIRYEKNKDKIKDKCLSYRTTHKEYYYEYGKSYYEKYTYKFKEWAEKRKQLPWYKIAFKRNNHNRRARINNAYNDWSITKANLDRLFILQNYKCWYCWCDIDERNSHLDHINPLFLWGSHTLDNVHWTCPRCNLKKWYKSHEEFLQILKNGNT